MLKSLKPQAGYRQSLILGALIGITIAVAFAAGFLFHELVAPQPLWASSGSVSGNGYPLLDEVQALLDRYYLREQPDYAARQYGAIRGVLDTLKDRFTFFIEPPVAQSESDVLAGTYGGIGVLLKRPETGEFALYPYPDSAAAKAGIEDGDILRAVNGEPIEITHQQDAVDQLLRGEVKEGNGVEITVYKPKADKEYTVFILFDVVNVPSVLWRVLENDPRVGYVQILNFTNRTPSELTTALEGLHTANISALVLDFRDNRGGLLQESISVASQFISSGPIIYEKSAQSERSLDAEPGGQALEWPLVVLVNAETASAAELVAAAIQDYGRGIIIGQRTFGKGTVQQMFRLSDGSSIHITSAEFFTPDHRALDSVGLEPDIPMIPDENGRDVETGEAVRYLQRILTEQGISR